MSFALPQMSESLGTGKKKTAVNEDAFTIPDEFLDDFDEAPPRPPPPVESKPARPPPPSDDDNFPAPPPEEFDAGKVGSEIDNLTKLLVKNMEHAGEEGFFGFCYLCEKKVIGSENGCQANGKTYHKDCFICQNCKTELRGKPFFTLEDRTLCDTCYHGTLEKCKKCNSFIEDRILRAMDHAYHPHCFVCNQCGKSLDGIPFTTDTDDEGYCLECFHQKFAPRCASCGEPIIPDAGKEETLRVISMDKSFHVGCFNCQDCGTSLSTGSDGQGCYPFEGMLLCRDCNIKRVQAAAVAKQ